MALRAGLAKVRLRVTRRVRQWHEGFLQAVSAWMRIIPHRRIAVVEAAFLMKAIVNSLDRKPLSLWYCSILMPALIDNADGPIELWTPQHRTLTLA